MPPPPARSASRPARHACWRGHAQILLYVNESRKSSVHA
jgi:hypothetical protein